MPISTLNRPEDFCLKSTPPIHSELARKILTDNSFRSIRTLAKLYTILSRVRLIIPGSNDALSRAFDAARSQLTVASRKYLRLQTLAFGSLGTIGSAVHPCAIEAWIKATNGKVTKFDDGSNALQAIDAGRVLLDRVDAPPIYQGIDDAPTDIPAVLTSQDLEAGRARLAILAEQTRRRRAEIEAAELAAEVTGPDGAATPALTLGASQPTSRDGTLPTPIESNRQIVV